MNRKKILLFIDGLDSGGAQRQLVGLAGILCESQFFDVLVISYKRNADFYATQLKKENVSFVIEEKCSNSRIRGLLVLKKHCARFKPDLIISFLGETNLFSSIYHLWNGTPLIVSERNTIIVPTFFDKVRYFLYKRVDCIVPNSYSQTKYIEDNYPELKNKVETIINFVDTDKFKPKQNSENECSDCVRIIVVARVQPQKNVLNFIQALSVAVREFSQKIVVDWFGDLSNSKYVEECKSLCKNLNVQSILNFKGETQDVIEQYARSDALCLPSLYEGTPNVICEAMACGLPILCSDVCDNYRYVENGINGFRFNPNDKNDMALKIKDFARMSSENKKNMSLNSRSMAIDMFSKKVFAEKWTSVVLKWLR